MIKNCVDLKKELDNPIIKNLSVLDDNIYIYTKDSEGKYITKTLAVNGRWPSYLKYVKNIEDLIFALEPFGYEKIVYEITPGDENKFNADSIIPIDFEEKVEKQTERAIGDKLYLVSFDDFSINGIGKDINYFLPAQVKMLEDGNCIIEGVNYTSDSKRELNENLAFHFGGYSGLYYLTNNKEVMEKYTDIYCEATKLDQGKWEIIKLDKTKARK